MFGKFFGPYYYKKEDNRLPGPARENIILSLSGMQEIANFYKEKYGIEIIAFESLLSEAPRILAKNIAKIRKRSMTRCAFIFQNMAMGPHGHSFPMVWEKHEGQEFLYFLDTGQMLGNCDFEEPYDFIILASQKRTIDIHSLPGEADKAYVLSENSFVFVQKSTNTVTELLAFLDPHSKKQFIDGDKLKKIAKYCSKLHFDHENQDFRYMTLSKAQIGEIEKITKKKITAEGRMAAQFREKLLSLVPNLQLYSSLGKRQIDHTSCTVDALVILKDALRLNPSLTAIAQQKIAKQFANLKLFYMPEELLKTAQIGSYPEKSRANRAKPIHLHNEKDSFGKKTGLSVLQTLGMFRARYDIPVRFKDEEKYFGSYTLEKGRRYSELINTRKFLQRP